MEFLKEILGDDLFGQVQEKINAHNNDEANKDKQIKIANLGAGDYVAKGKFDSKDAELIAKVKELAEANNLIADLKKGNKDNESLQQKIKDYDSQIAQLQTEVQEAKVKAAIKVGLISEHAVDVDYLTYKLNEKLTENGECLELDENENIKGWKDKIEGLKIQFPTQFETSGAKKISEQRLPSGDDERKLEPNNLAEALQMKYEQKE